MVYRQGVNGATDHDSGRLTSPAGTEVMKAVRKEARNRGLPYGVGKLAVGWAGPPNGTGIDMAHCAIYRIEGKGGSPLVVPTTFVAGLGERVCVATYPFANAALGVHGGVTPNIAAVPDPATAVAPGLPSSGHRSAP